MEKGSMLTAIEHGSVGPKRMAKAISESKAVLKSKNVQVDDGRCRVYAAKKIL